MVDSRHVGYDTIDSHHLGYDMIENPSRNPNVIRSDNLSHGMMTKIAMADLIIPDHRK
jgi:hypothetical protein